jgi:hypothetical protein
MSDFWIAVGCTGLWLLAIVLIVIWVRHGTANPAPLPPGLHHDVMIDFGRDTTPEEIWEQMRDAVNDYTGEETMKDDEDKEG